MITPSPIAKFYESLCQKEPVYVRLAELKEKGWKNPKGDEYFQRQRQRADTATREAAARFYRMMQEIGDEMQRVTGALRQNNRSSDDFTILDLCMAPGGYTASALKHNPAAKAVGITLPPDQGGHQVFLDSSRSTVFYHDITMFAKEFGVDEVPVTHPGHASFSAERPFLNQRFDLVFCDGQVLRTHKRPEYRERTERDRLRISQLILALQRIRPGGTLIMLLHIIEALDTIELLYRFSQFSNIRVFKPLRKHAIRSTFYLIAKNVEPNSEAARLAVKAWKEAWWNATFGGAEGIGTSIDVDDDYAQSVIDAFGGRLTRLARPLWRIQADALNRTDFVH
ncbi:hypothetical protein BDZ45DRAFT_607666 [Acephala macrosclerotiorum]|nr:hypothetical protein BDZ45DRAFT_607666 [Acephala macrosclerotiorum]